MCEYCEKYGVDGQRWFLNPANSARRLTKVRKPESESTGAGENPNAEGGDVGMGATHVELIEMKRSGPEEYARRLADLEKRAPQHHIGQVMTLEEAQALMDISWPIAKMTCGCRRSTRGLPDEENFSCMGMGPGMYKWERWPQIYRGGVEFTTPDQAKAYLSKLNKKGLVHIVETFGTPYVGGVCNCEYPDCSAIRGRIDYDMRWSALKGHYVAMIDMEACNGCKKCLWRCHFRALNFSVAKNKAHINQFNCFGCGNCRSECDFDAIQLVERSSLPALANEW